MPLGTERTLGEPNSVSIKVTPPPLKCVYTYKKKKKKMTGVVSVVKKECFQWPIAN